MRQQVALVKGAQRAFMQTEIERRFYLQQGADAGRLTIAGVGVDPAAMLGGSAERFRQKYGIDLPFVTYIGAMAYDKGTEHLVEAMRFLWDKRRQEPLVLAGPDMESFTRFLEKQDAIVQRNVRHLGYISEEDKRDLLAAADVLAMPSRTDSFGIVFLEAWLNRKPVIGARAGGIPAVISEGEDGLLVDFGDAHELAAKIELLLDDQSLRERLGESGYRKTMAHYTWDRIWPIVRQGYERALAELGRGQ